LKKLRKTYFPFTRATIQEILAYPGEALLHIFGMTIGMFVIYYIWKVIYTTGDNQILEGFSLKEMVAYIVLSFGVIQAINNGTIWNIAMDIREGNIIMNMIKPINYHLRIYFQEMGYVIFISSTVLLPIVLSLVFIFKTGTVLSLILFTISLFLGVLVSFLFDFLFGMLAFYIKNLWGIGFGKNALVRLLSGALIPLAFFPESVQKVFEFLPFKAMVYGPIMIFLGKYNSTELISIYMNQLFWIALLALFNYLTWQKALSRLTVQGG